MKNLFAVTVFALMSGLGASQMASADVSEAKADVLSCHIVEQTVQGQQPAIEDTTRTQVMLPNNNLGSGVLFSELKYTTQDGLFEIDAQAIMVAPHSGHTDYLPIWIKNLKTGESIAANGNPSGGGSAGPNNDVTGLSGAFPTSIDVECSMSNGQTGDEGPVLPAPAGTRPITY